MLQTLREVHRQGYVHNDIRPANILSRPSDPLQPFVLIDFGDAERRGAAGRYRGTSNAGTVPSPVASYDAPERSGGGPGYYCSDLFSLGVIAIQLLTGAELKDLTWGVHGHVILPLYPFAKDPVLERVLVSMTCRFPWQRYQDADEALAALTKQETGEILDKPVERPRLARTVIAFLALILLLWLGSIAWKSAVVQYCRQSIDCQTTSTAR
jgi:serine/threonine-protein kinase